MSPEIAHPLLIGIVAVSILLMLIRPKNLPEVWWIGTGAMLLVCLRLVPVELAGKAIAKGSDVYLFLIGMMLLSEVARENGLFDWISTRAVMSSRRRCARLFSLVYGVGFLVTVCMSNDATAVVLTPAVLSAIRKAEIDPKPHLFACAMIANAASFVLPISNPANLVVFHDGMPPLGRWLASFLLPSALSILATFFVLRVFFRSELAAEIQCDLKDEPLPTSGKLVLGGLVLVVLVLLTASALNLDLGLPTCVSALVITGALSFYGRSNPLQLVRKISWSTLLLVAGLFVLVSAVESVGVLKYTEAALRWAQRLPSTLATIFVGLGVGIANNLVNNLPLGLLAGATIHAAHLEGLIANAVLVGVDLGPNLSVTGSLATILWLLAIRKENLKVSAWDFLKVGLLAMPAAMLASCGGLLLMHAFTHQAP